MQPLATNNHVAKIVLKFLSVSVRSVLFLTIAIIVSGSIYGKNDLHTYLQDTLNYEDSIQTSAFSNDSLIVTVISDSLQASDTTLTDSLSVVKKPAEKKSDRLEDKVTYSSTDSMRVEIQTQKLHLYGDAKVDYENIELKAYYIMLDLAKSEVFAKGITDSLGNTSGKPDFKQGSKSFQSDSIRYNFDTKSGIIYHMVTKEGEGYLHSEKTKRHPDEHIHLENGKYTTCDADHPHFYLALTKGIVIPDDKIITGPAYLVVADVPIRFFGIPFGFFPNTTERASGILIPTYGEERGRGFFLRDLGWYQVLGDYADWRIQADAYTSYSWAVRNTVSYKWRYHFNGNFSFNYAVNDNKNELNYPKKKDYSLRWSHRQDAKANPTQNFSASVNFSSSEYDRYHSYNSSDYLNTSTNSSISYTKRWPNTPFNLSLSANANQNRQTEKVDLNVPTGSFNMSSIYPFRSKNGAGDYKWYENISLTYSSNFKNQVNTYNNVVFEPETWKDSLKNGFEHSVPLAINFKLGKLVTITPSINYRGVLFTQYSKYSNVVEYDSTSGDYVKNKIVYNKLKYEQAVNPSVSVSFTPKFYGILNSTKEDSYIEAIRHVMSPTASFSFVPDMRKINNVDYYDTLHYFNNRQNRWESVPYSWYDGQLFNPPAINGRSGSLRLALNNTLEMKVRPKNDTTGESKKVTLLDNLNFATSYNPFKDSPRWEDISMVTGTRLFDKLDIRVNGRFSPYALDSLGRKKDEFYIKNHRGKLARFVSLSVNTSFGIRSAQGGDENKTDENEVQGTNEDVFYDDYYLEDDPDFIPGSSIGNYVDFDIPWSLNINHSFSIIDNPQGKPNITHTMNLSGDISLTSKWKIGGQMNYDLEQKKVSYTTLNIYRDLHCWEMRFTVVPFGTRTSYSFTIQAKGSLLRDLKYEKKPNWYDRF